MDVKLTRINIDDSEKLWEMQIDAFKDLLEKYQDFDTSPGNESKEKIEAKLLQDFTYFYYIYVDKDIVGAVRVVDKKDENRKSVAPIFILKKFRNKGLAQKAFYKIEKIHGERNWRLYTIFQEKGNCHLYEKLGYIKTGKLKNINNKMDIICYEKD